MNCLKSNASIVKAMNVPNLVPKVWTSFQYSKNVDVYFQIPRLEFRKQSKIPVMELNDEHHSQR